MSPAASVDTKPAGAPAAAGAAGHDHNLDWDLARRIAVRIAGDEPLYRSYLGVGLHDDFAEATPIAEKLVEAETRLNGHAGAAVAVVIDRAAWIDANIGSFRRLLKPVLGGSGTDAGSDDDGTAVAGTALKLARKVGAVELGAVLGWMARRVLGQYDLLLATDDESADAGADGVVYYVGPNILATEKRFAFPPGEFRLWLALHELTHRSQFTGVPWLRPHFLSLVGELVEAVEPDVDRIRAGLRNLISERRAGRDPLAEGGLAAVFATERQRCLIDQVGGMMSLVEGHGDATMARAAQGHVPSAERFHTVMHHRRTTSRPLARLLQRLMGIEAKLLQYQAGEEFIAAIEADRGARAVDRIWEDVEFLPTLAEIRDPAAWMARVPAA